MLAANGEAGNWDGKVQSKSVLSGFHVYDIGRHKDSPLASCNGRGCIHILRAYSRVPSAGSGHDCVLWPLMRSEPGCGTLEPELWHSKSAHPWSASLTAAQFGSCWITQTVKCLLFCLFVCFWKTFFILRDWRHGFFPILFAFHQRLWTHFFYI